MHRAGVVSVFTENGSEPPQASAQFVGGSYATSNAIAKFTVSARPVDYVVAANRFSTDGLPRSQRGDARILPTFKLTLVAAPDTKNHDHREFALPAGSAGSAGPHPCAVGGESQQVDPAASIRFGHAEDGQSSCKAARDNRGSASAPIIDLRVTAYGGSRQVRQYLALPGLRLRRQVASPISIAISAASMRD
jgi:iron complex outermembrane receptor protein